MKYIIFDVKFEDKEEFKLPIIFHNSIIHSEMAGIIIHSLIIEGAHIALPYSAGFIHFNNKCFGRSESLNLDSKENDDIIIRDSYFV